MGTGTFAIGLKIYYGYTSVAVRETPAEPRSGTIRCFTCLHFIHENELFLTTPPATQSRELSTMSSVGVSSVENSTIAIKRLLAKAQVIKPNGGVEPTLTTQELEGGIEEIGKQNGSINRDYAAIETACRDIFYALLVRLSWIGNLGQ